MLHRKEVERLFYIKKNKYIENGSVMSLQDLQPLPAFNKYTALICHSCSSKTFSVVYESAKPTTCQCFHNKKKHSVVYIDVRRKLKLCKSYPKGTEQIDV